MESDDEIELAAITAVVVHAKKRMQGNKRLWVQPWLLRRRLFGAYETLLQEVLQEDAGACKSFLRMEQCHFQELCTIVGPSIAKTDTNMRQSISANERLAITLRFLASGKRNCKP